MTSATMYTKYYDVWSAQSAIYGSKTAVLYQVGGFFEIFDTENLVTGKTQANIREVAEICQLSLSISVKDDGLTQTLFSGFPENALNKYETLLVSQLWTVVVVVQIKRLNEFERVIDHISSPGCTNTSDTMDRRLVGCTIESLRSHKNTLQQVYWAISTLEIATGSINFTEGNSSDRLHQYLCVNPPTELIVWSDGNDSANALTDILKTVCKTVHIKCITDSCSDVTILERFWNLKSLSWIHRHPQSRHCLASLMAFANDHIPSALKSLELPVLWVPTGEVRVGNAALAQLGITCVSQNQNTETNNLHSLLDKCVTAAGRRLMRTRLLRPITNTTILNDRLDQIDRAGNREPISTMRGLRSLYDISRLWRRMELGKATMNDVSCLLQSYTSAISLGYSDPTYFDWLFSQWNISSVIDLARESKDAPVSQLPFITGRFPILDSLFAEGHAIREKAIAICDKWSQPLPSRKTSSNKDKEKENKETLYLEDVDGGGFRIIGTTRRISAAYAVLRDGGDTTATITHHKSTSILTTSELEILSNTHRTWINKWIPVWNMQWMSAIAETVSRGRKVTNAIDIWCAELDISWTMYSIAFTWRWTRPIFIEDQSSSSLDVTDLRHPVIERLINVPYVSHSIQLSSQDQEGGIILYGMNASGKSSLMKALGIAVVLAQTGFPVPATLLKIRPFTSIFTRILGNDNLWAGLSSFAVEMTEFREILQFADDSSLVLGDELCSGTESLSATALVAAGVETLSERGTKFVFATHLHELAALTPSSVRTMHMKVEYDAVSDRLIYDRTLTPGSGSALYGLEVCRALDLPPSFLDRATYIRKQLSGWIAPHKSVYSVKTIIYECEICKGTNGLETHHIIAQADGGDDTIGNLVCLCSQCHDDHHGGRICIDRWVEQQGQGQGQGNRVLKWEKVALDPTEPDTHVHDSIVTWIVEQRFLKTQIPVIKRMAKKIFGVELTTKQIKSNNN